MKKISRVLLVVMMIFAVLPAGAVLANPNATGDLSYLYLIPQEDGSLSFEYKFNGSAQPEMNFPIAEDAENLEAIAGAKVVDGKIVAEEEEGRVAVNYKFTSKKESFVYSSPFTTTFVTILVPSDTGIVTSKDVEISSEGTPMAFGDESYHLFMATVEGADASVVINFEAGKAVETEDEEAPASDNAEGSDDLVSDVKRESPEYHTPGHIRLWNETPFSKMNAHLFMIALSVIVIGGVGFYVYFLVRDRKRAHGPENEMDEEEFVALIARRNAILSRVTEMEEAFAKGEVDEDEYLLKEATFRKELVQVTLELRKYTE